MARKEREDGSPFNETAKEKAERLEKEGRKAKLLEAGLQNYFILTFF